MTAPAMQFQFTRAARHAVKLKIGVDGPSGSGKTYGALALARGITNGGRIAVADSENDSASLYSDTFAFDRVIVPDAAPGTYAAIIDAAVAGGYDALVIDSISHAWLTVLAEKEDYDRKNPKTNSWTNWRVFGPKWDNLMQHLLRAPIHVVATMRSKQAYEQVDTGGKKQVIKLGLQPQVRDGAEYEFGIVFSVDHSHQAEATKDRTRLFADRRVDLSSAAVHQELVAWMNAGGDGEPASVPPAPRPVAIVPTPTTAAPTNGAAPAAPAPAHTLEWARALPLPFKASNAYGTPIGNLSVDGLQALIPWIEGKQQERGLAWHAETLVAMKLVLGAAEDGADDDGDMPAVAAGSGAPVDTKLAPGKIEDALDKPDKPATPEAPSLTKLSQEIAALLAHEKLDENDRKVFRAKLTDATTTSSMQALIVEIQHRLELPF